MIPTQNQRQRARAPALHELTRGLPHSYKIGLELESGDYSNKESRTLMTALLVIREIFARRRCSLIATRSSAASFLISTSLSGPIGSLQRVRMRSQSASIWESVELGTTGVYTPY